MALVRNVVFGRVEDERQNDRFGREIFMVPLTLIQCNNPQTKEPKLDSAVRIIPEWKEYDEEIKQILQPGDVPTKHAHTHDEGEL